MKRTPCVTYGTIQLTNINASESVLEIYADLIIVYI